MLHLTRILTLATTAFILVAAATPATAQTPPLRRVVLISCDTLRAASLPAYGNAGVTTTGIDSLAAAGTLFLNCATPMGWTLPAHMAMLTGMDPGVTRVGVETALPEGVPILPEILAGAGFTAGAYVAENRWLDPGYGFGRGFDEFRMCDQLGGIRQWTDQWTVADDLAGGAPFFLFFHFMDTHTVPVEFDHLLPYWALRGVERFYQGIKAPLPEPQLTPAGGWDLAAYDPDLLRRAYDSTVGSLDFMKVRPLLQRLRDKGLAEDAMIILTADHGEELAEHGGYEHDAPYTEVRNVPLIVVWPGVLPAGRVVYTPVTIADIMPTVLDFAELPVPDTVQGLSLRPLLDGSDGFFPERDFLVDGRRRGLGLQPAALTALHDDAMWTLVTTVDTTGCAGSFAPPRPGATLGLYLLDADPGETNDLQAARPEVVAALRERMSEMLADEAALAEVVHRDRAARELPLSDEDRRKLRALGY
jgi:arylsulfatase A-like enzyme